MPRIRVTFSVDFLHARFKKPRSENSIRLLSSFWNFPLFGYLVRVINPKDILGVHLLPIQPQNTTMTSLYDVLMHNVGENGSGAMETSSCSDKLTRPSLVPASDGEDSSLESESSHQQHLQQSMDFSTALAPKLGLLKKRVRWDMIQTREYSLVVGDHPFCQDGLPVSLDWQYHDSCSSSSIDSLPVSERKESYVFPRRLSYEERRDRLCSVSGLTAEQVKNEEIELVVRTLKEAWEQVTDQVLDPMADMIWDEIPGLDCDLTDLSDFEWSDDLWSWLPWLRC